MSEWWTYRPSDFLLFSPRVYERLVSSHNVGLWPWQLAALGAGLTALWLLSRRRPTDGRIALGLGGAAAGFVAWSFLWSRYAGVNWAAGYGAAAFALQSAAMLAVAAISKAPLIGRGRRNPPPAGLLLIAIALYPLAAIVSQRPWSAVEVAGIMPDPTALALLGLAALIRNGALAAGLAIAPLVWSAYSAMTLFTLGFRLEAGAMTLGLTLFAAAAVARARS